MLPQLNPTGHECLKDIACHIVLNPLLIWSKWISECGSLWFGFCHYRHRSRTFTFSRKVVYEYQTTQSFFFHWGTLYYFVKHVHSVLLYATACPCPRYYLNVFHSSMPIFQCTFMDLLLVKMFLVMNGHYIFDARLWGGISSESRPILFDILVPYAIEECN